MSVSHSVKARKKALFLIALTFLINVGIFLYATPPESVQISISYPRISCGAIPTQYNVTVYENGTVSIFINGSVYSNANERNFQASYFRKGDKITIRIVFSDTSVAKCLKPFIIHVKIANLPKGVYLLYIERISLYIKSYILRGPIMFSV